MADTKISALPAASTPLTGSEVVPLNQSGVTSNATVANLTAGRAISALSVTSPTIGATTSTNLNLQSNATTNAILDSSGNFLLGLATNPQSSRLVVQGAASSVADFESTITTTAGGGIRVSNSGTTELWMGYYQFASNMGAGVTDAGLSARNNLLLDGTNAILFGINGTEKARIDTSGNLLVGQSSTIGTGGRVQVISNTDTLYSQTSSNTTYAALVLNVQNTSARLAAFQYGNTTTVGTITTNGTTTSYNVTSDRRLKENIAPFNNGLQTISALKPCQYNYISDKEVTYQGFIADELQSVVPQAVTGKVNEVDAEGKPIYQGVDASFLIPHLVAAIQELKTEFDAYKATHP